MKRKIPPLIVEALEEQCNLYMLSLIEYRRNQYTCVIDNVTSSDLRVYVVDQFHPDALTAKEIISEAIYWYYDTAHKQQFSIHLATRGLHSATAPLYKTFDLNGVSRVVGKAFNFPELTKSKVKKRRVLPIQEGIEIKLKKTI